jgi:hypothetical protein
MFMITGALYTWGYKGSYENEVYEVPLSQPLSADLVGLKSRLEAELASREIGTPEGQPRVKTYGSHFLLEWTGSSKDVIFEPTGDPRFAKLTVKNTTWYRALVQLHKAKGGTAFKVYAGFFALIVALLLLSGYMMAWQMPKLRVPTALATVLGLVTFFVMVWLG